MIDPIQGMASGEAPAAPRADLARGAASTEATPAAPVPPAGPPPVGDAVLNVLLDGETMRLYTELRDPQTDRLLLRLPAAYDPGEARLDEGASFEA
ncbi:hypothetical protein [Roseomonas haemaphysalidis]|jgi:hypothetical protein|uniref:Uncharacterized protein n=1 Tax=Roseomonas haemaphysalidis TaxID=2768162 RepID=A0ABS3KU97_9PROT|nr:hypothetical protein [Roseomonas haemaphysalidis]MBO1080510.1 hypothetical protein [Roseomonas haemaphysalidis]